MASFEYLIAGSGPAGVAAGQILAGSGTAILDAGERPDSPPAAASLRQALAAGCTRELLGADWETLANLADQPGIHPKLRARGVRHIAAGEPATITHSAGTTLCRGSYARGGFAGAWGAQLLRYRQCDLDDCGDWPISCAELTPYYDSLEAEIGISGAADDVADFAPVGAALLPPIPVVGCVEVLLSRYAAKRSRIRRSGLSLGRPRLAVLTRPYGGRPAHTFGEMEFFAAEQPGKYSPVNTLEKLVGSGGVTYLPGRRLISFREIEGGVECECAATGTASPERLVARHLLLACGVLHTSKMVLRMYGAPGRSLPFQDHPPMLLPLFCPAGFGAPLPSASFPIQAMGCFEQDGEQDMLSLYYCGGMLRSDLLSDIPLPLPESLELIDGLLGGLLVLQVWRPSRPSPLNRLMLDSEGSIRIDYPDRPAYPHIRPLIRALRRLGVYTTRRLAREAPPGWGFHYVGTLPMRTCPGPFETHVDGRLWNGRRVRVIDGCVLPSLPSKNHSLTLMANAARIAAEVKRCGY